jgi:hypothetical protein
MPARLRFAFATTADEAELRALLRDNPMRGTVTVGFTHEPDYFRGTSLAGATDQTLLARENGRLVAAGRCTTRRCWLNGGIRQVAYLGELRLVAGVQGRWDILRAGYGFFAEAYALDPPDFCFTSIVADNHRARRLFERGLRGLPRYHFIGDYLTRLIPTGPGSVSPEFKIATGADLPAGQLTDFLNTVGQTRHLAAHWSPEILGALAGSGLQPQDLVVLLRGDEIVGCAGVWNQQSFRQVRIHGYGPLFTAVRPFHNLLAPLLRQPSLPPAGSNLNQALLTPFACSPDHATAPAALLQAAREIAARRGLDCLALGGTATDPWLTSLRGRRYPSRLYRVDWPGARPAVSALDARPCQPEIGLL